MLEHLEPGTQRLAEPVSSTTLKVWGGVPMVISEKYWLLTDGQFYGRWLAWGGVGQLTH